LKKEIEIFKESAHLDSKDTLKIKLNNFNLEKEDINELLNVSVLEVNLFNLAENFHSTKKFIIQFVKDKGIFYKNII
jgi:hypothetical protein